MQVLGLCGRQDRDRFLVCEVWPLLPCSRLRDSGEKSFSKKKCEKLAGAGERQGGGALSPIFLAATAPFPKSRPSYFRFARFNTSALYYLRAWHRLGLYGIFDRHVRK